MKVLIVRDDNAAEVREIPANADLLREIVGGWLEGISARIGLGEWFAYCDEESKLKGRPINMPATMLARRFGWRTGDVLCGTVVFVSQGREGEGADVPDVILEAARELDLLEGPPAG